MKHNYIVRTLEDELLLSVLEAMQQQRYLQLRVLSSCAAEPDAPAGHTDTYLPLRISISSQTGRRYLIAYSHAADGFRALRLDFIRDAVPGAPCEKYAQYQEMLSRELPHVFGVSFPKSGQVPVEMRVYLRILPEEGYVYDRLLREMRSGTLEQTGETTYRLTLSLYDPQETFPWLRTFTGRILAMDGVPEGLRAAFWQDFRETARLYEEDDHADIS